MSAWKDLERRVCRALGSSRRGQVTGSGWAKGSDNDETGPFSIECKRTKRYQLPRRWINQARRHGKAEGRPWLLVISEHNDRRPLAVMDFWRFAELCQDAGWLGDLDVRAKADRIERLHDAVGPTTVDEDHHVAGVVDMLEERGL
jgi:hypothetical protein